MNDLTIDSIFRTHFSSVGTGVRDEQRVVIESVLGGNNTLSLMPTGGGKSLCYWIAGKTLGGSTIVIFPLTALMDEQAAKLRGHGMKVTVLHSGIPSGDQYRELLDLARGVLPDFIFVSPERLAVDGFLEFLLRKRRSEIKLAVIDEIHCISQWGHDFRPFYKEIPPFLDAIFGDPARWPTILGLTATLSRKDAEQVCQDFYIDTPNVLRSKYLLRHTIEIEVVKVGDEPEKDQQLWGRLRQHIHEKVLVYVENKRSGDRSTEGMAKQARDGGFAAAYFHGEMESREKADVIRRFKLGEVRTVFATSAFGMGIDIPDIRGVIHYRPPESIEQYYQQIGRVGRDGRPAWALIYFSDKNIQFRKRYFIDKSFPTADEVKQAFERMTAGEGHIKSLNYFDEVDTQKAFHYLLHGNVLSIECKGIQKIDVFDKASGASLPEFDRYQSASRLGLSVLVAERSQVSLPKIMEDIYTWLAHGQIKAASSPQKCLFIEQLADKLPTEQIDAIAADIAEKRTYRYGLLDDLASLLNGFVDSNSCHDEIGRYLGVDEFESGRLHQTVSGMMVRSKSEVIIANLLSRHEVPFAYEQKLRAGGRVLCPDFTITIGDKTYYWEHLGLLDQEQYRQRWEIKKRIYEVDFPGQLIITRESPTLSRAAEGQILRLVSPNAEPEPLGRVSAGSGSTGPQLTNTSVSQQHKVHVLTEGPTDWKHLKAAYRALTAAGEFCDLNLVLDEITEDRGDRELLNTCRALCRTEPISTTILLFDRDVPQTLRQVVDDGLNYKKWGTRVYSVPLPVPEHRIQTPEISIEFYYSDDVIKRKDAVGRRLFIGTEFRSRALTHISEPLTCADRNKVGRFTVVDTQVYRIDSESEENIALSKNDFAQRVLDEVPPFDSVDFAAFGLLFELFRTLAELDR